MSRRASRVTIPAAACRMILRRPARSSPRRVIPGARACRRSSCRNAWTADFADPVSQLEVFLKDSGSNWTGWGDPAYDRALAEAATTPDQARRFELFQQAEAILLEQAPIAPLIFGARNYLIHPTVRGWEPAPVGINQYKKVYLKGP
jgi:oligopeptide transport system substrate-binding protein